MPRAYLISETENGSTRSAPVGDRLVAGRTADNGLVIRDRGASRRHLEIVAKEGRYFWEDLNTTNGTIVNDEPMLQGELKNGDRIRVGQTVYLFKIVDEDETREEPDLSNSTWFNRTVLSADGAVEPVEDEESPADRLLEALHTVMNDIATDYDPCGLVDRVLETTMKAIDAQRGAMLFTGPDTSELLPCPVCRNVHVIEDGKLRHASAREFQISSTVANRVLQGGESVLYTSSGSDAEVASAKSIVAMDVRSVICVPVRGKYSILGILYIDSNRPRQQYKRDHMLLSTAVGNSAGLALENARMHQDILEQTRFQQELEYAGKIQESFLIKAWPRAEQRFEVYGETRPAKTVGGDLYDFIQPDRDHVGILIGDVSGKGIPAALTMAQLLAQFRGVAMREKSPAKVLAYLNRDLVYRSQRGMFCTMCYYLLDLNSGELKLANAGHHAALKLNRLTIEEIGAGQGIPIGILADATWEDMDYVIEPGDTLLMYTDGIVEARRPNTGEGFEEATVDYGLSALRGLAKGLVDQPVEVLAQEVLRDVQHFCAPEAPHDDCTLMALRLHG